MIRITFLETSTNRNTKKKKNKKHHNYILKKKKKIEKPTPNRGKLTSTTITS